VSDLAASAAYLLASAATSITVTETGQVGSIGVVLRHLDVSEALSKQGVKVTHIHAGAHKVDGNPYEPLPDSVRAQLQQDVNHYYDLFVNAVATYRGIDPITVRATEAKMFVAERALELGLIDQIAQPPDFLSSLTTEVRVDTLEMKEEVSSLLTLNAELQTQLTDLQAEYTLATEGLSEEVLRLQGQLKVETDRVSVQAERIMALEAQLSQLQSDHRTEVVQQLFADLGREYSAEAARPYLAMDAETFDVVAADLRALKPVLSNDLFRDIAVRPIQESATEASLAAQLFNQVAGVK
jgi:ClpP class serine protease